MDTLFWVFVGIMGTLILVALIISVVCTIQYYRADEKDRVEISVKPEDWLINDFKKKYHF